MTDTKSRSNFKYSEEHIQWISDHLEKEWGWPRVVRAFNAIFVEENLDVETISEESLRGVYRYRTKATVRDGTYRVLIVPDIHIPFQDRKVLGGMRLLIPDLECTDIVFIGDVFDCASISRFDKDPRRIKAFMTEFEEGIDELKLWLQAANGARVHYVIGNHEKRLFARLRRRVPELLGAIPSNWEDMIKFHSPDVYNSMIIHPDGFELAGFKFVHGGQAYSKFSAYSAKAHAYLYHKSGFSGHTHRVGSYYETTEDSTIEWHEVGHVTMQEEYADYITGTPNWQKAFATLEVSPDKEFPKIQIVRIDSKSGFWYGNQYYGD